jgi:Phytanoyl-CoA dioxygenase (PhyH)
VARVSVASAVKTRLDDRIAQTKWRLRNRDRSGPADPPPGLGDVVERLRSDGVVITDFATVFGDTTLFDEAALEVRRRYERVAHADPAAEAGSKATFLTKLGDESYSIGHPFARIALDSRALAVANGYLKLRSTLRALDVWHTHPTPGPAIQTQLWHRDGDDVVNVKMFVYFTDVTLGAGPLCYARGTHPYGSRRELPEGDEQARSTDEQLREVAPEDEWTLCEGRPGTVVFADTCGYHKQVKPESDERMLLVAHYVSGTPFVPRVVELTGVDESSLGDDQYVAVFDRVR